MPQAGGFTTEKLIYRKATEADLWDSARIHQITRNDMLTRNGRTPPPDNLEGTVCSFRHILQTGIFDVAEVDGKVVAICNGIVRDQVWFLSSFWVLPELQKRHIGGPLLKSVWEQGVRSGAQVFFVWASVDTTAMASYFKLGMLPGTQLLNFAATADRVSLPTAPSGYTTERLTAAGASAVDMVVLSTPRPADHHFWLSCPDRHGFLVRKGGTPCGYYYVTDQGEVVPAAWREPTDGEAVLTLACRDAQDRAGFTLLNLPGCNHVGIAFAMRAGFTLKGFFHFLTTAPFGRLEQYAPSGPLLF